MTRDDPPQPYRVIRHRDIQRCPLRILTADHYHLDGTCRCNDKGDQQ